MPILKKNTDFVSKRKEATLMGQIDELKKSIRDQKELIKMLANKTGYTLNEIEETEAGSKIYEFVKDEVYTDPGTYLTPTEYKPGMAVVMYTNPDPFSGDGWYSFDGDVKVCIKTGIPKDFNDTEYFVYEV